MFLFKFFVGVIPFFFPLCAFAQEPLPPLLQNERVLILAPHPDDETLGAAGIIQSALASQAEVKVVYLTNGDYNGKSFIVHEKRLVIKKAAVLAMGQVRRDEAVAAMASLGLDQKHLIFLGYPDGGTLQIFLRHWGVLSQPRQNPLTRSRNVPYTDAVAYGAPYVGESILPDIKKILKDFKPTRIFVSHPLDNNPDHRAAYLFLRVALWDLEKQIPSPEIYPYLVHESRWPHPRGYHPELPLEPPATIKSPDAYWKTFGLTPEQVTAKKGALELYKTQTAYSAQYLFSFARGNELFGDYAPIALNDLGDSAMRALLAPTSPGLEVSAVDEAIPDEPILGGVAFARSGGDLLVRVTSASWKDKLLGLRINLVGYRRGLPFSFMPKYQLRVTFSRFVSVYEKGRPAFIRDMEISRHGSTMIIRVPLSSLENPHFILTSARSSLKNRDVDRTAWRVLIVE